MHFAVIFTLANGRKSNHLPFVRTPRYDERSLLGCAGGVRDKSDTIDKSYLRKPLLRTFVFAACRAVGLDGSLVFAGMSV